MGFTVVKSALRSPVLSEALVGNAERVALAQVSGLEASAEPAGALRGSAVGEGFGHDLTPALLLQAVVADRPGGPHGLLDVAFLEDVFHLVRVVRPDAREEVGLQLEAHRRL